MKIKTNDGGHNQIKSVELIQKSNGDYELQLIDQRFLPHQLLFFKTQEFKEVIYAIKEMVVRGAPAIGATAVFGMVLGIQQIAKRGKVKYEQLIKLNDEIITARPTAKDLESFLIAFLQRFDDQVSINLLEAITIANNISKENENECYDIGVQSKHLIKEKMGVLTHCNAGALATIDYGTALSPIRLAHYDGVRFKVYVDETRPRLQGMLTAWELYNEGIDHVIIVDNAAGFFMQQEKIQLVITGCDRVLGDGTVTNKIGTFEKAVVAKSLGIPFYVAMPWTTYDPNINSVSDIPIEFRSSKEITHFATEKGYFRISNVNSPVINPAFDITPPSFITGYITKDGIIDANELQVKYDLHQK